MTSRQHADHEHDRDHDHDHVHPTGIKGFFFGLFVPHTHDASDSIDDAMEASREGVRALVVSLVLLLITTILQAVVVAISGSVALLADAVHNFSDALTAVPLWVAFVIGRRIATKRYTFGYGRAEDLAGLFIIVVVALSAVVAAWQSIDRLLNPRPLENIAWVVAAGVIGFLGNEAVAVYRIRVGRRIGSAALVADGLHARTDGFTSLAVVVGAIGVMLGFPLADPIIGLIITVAILAVLKGAATDVFQRLMDAVDPAVVDRAEQALRAVPAVSGVDRVRMRWIGHTLHAEADVAVDDATDLAEAHELAHRCERELRGAVARLESATVHVHPAAAHPAAATSGSAPA